MKFSQITQIPLVAPERKPRRTPNQEDGTMLVLSRKANEQIRIGDSIVVTVVRVSGEKVRVGIDAPHELVVLRDELGGHVDQGSPPIAGEP